MDAGGGRATSTATCAVGDVLLSGGYELDLMDPFMAESVVIERDRPDGANGWTVTVTDYHWVGVDVLAWAVCATNPA